MSTNRENRRVHRLILEKPLKVMMGSIGSEVRYELKTRNISTNGLFLDFDKPGRFPFTPASIMEVWLELDQTRSIFFNGKMARIVSSHDPLANITGPGIAIKIVQIDRESETILREFITSRVSELPNKPGHVA